MKIRIVLLLILLLFSLRFILNLFEVFTVSSISMENTLFDGDRVLVKKQNFQDENFKNVKTHLRNKNIVFFKSFADNNIYIKRCVAISGDTIMVRNDSVFVNNTLLNINNSKFLYNIIDHNNNFGTDIKWTCNPIYLHNSHLLNNSNYYQALTFSGFKKMNNLKDSIEIKYVRDTTLYINNFFVKYRDWNQSNFGPVIISENLNHLNRIESNNFIWEVVDVNGFEQLSVTNEPYVFVMGDNTSFSTDSRHFGGVFINNIIGSASLILFSIDNNKKGIKKLRWDRILKVIE